MRCPSAGSLLLRFVTVAALFSPTWAWKRIFARDPTGAEPRKPRPAVDEARDLKCRPRIDSAKSRDRNPLRFINVLNQPSDDNKVEAIGFWRQQKNCAGPPDLIIRYTMPDLDGIYLIDLGGPLPDQGIGLAGLYNEYKPLDSRSRWFQQYVQGPIDDQYQMHSAELLAGRIPDDNFEPIYLISDIKDLTVQYYTVSALPYVRWIPLPQPKEGMSEAQQAAAEVKYFERLVAKQIAQRELLFGAYGSDEPDFDRIQWIQESLNGGLSNLDPDISLRSKFVYGDSTDNEGFFHGLNADNRPLDQDRSKFNTMGQANVEENLLVQDILRMQQLPSRNNLRPQEDQAQFGSYPAQASYPQLQYDPGQCMNVMQNNILMDHLARNLPNFGYPIQQSFGQVPYFYNFQQFPPLQDERATNLAPYNYGLQTNENDGKIEPLGQSNTENEKIEVEDQVEPEQDKVEPEF
ncbi:hypothetical protein TWF696_004606 [Orbilia brochopaga]|uniref:Uncharacterized protein n=1 Tax=Orbilia brochopaga TaxID=3140254 RepID=A0AAV9V6L8_9PEZI